MRLPLRGPADDDRRAAALLPLGSMALGWAAINEPKLLYFSNRLDSPREEVWAGLLLGGYSDLLGSDFRFNDIEVVPDRREYAPGDKVKLQVNTNQAGAAVLLFVRPAIKRAIPRPIRTMPAIRLKMRVCFMVAIPMWLVCQPG